MTIQMQLIWLFVLSTPVACVAWTVTHEEVFREPREYCIEKVHKSKTFLQRKFFYLFTCEYCFSHYVAALFLLITKFTLLYTGWRGYLIAGFSMVWIANIYMSLYALIKMDVKKEKAEAAIREEQLEQVSK
jgi:hypothetical protein